MKYRLADVSDGTWVEFNPKAGTVRWKMADADMRDFLVMVGGFSMAGMIDKIIMDVPHLYGYRTTDMIDVDQMRRLYKLLLDYGYKKIAPSWYRPAPIRENTIERYKRSQWYHKKKGNFAKVEEIRNMVDEWYASGRITEEVWMQF